MADGATSGSQLPMDIVEELLRGRFLRATLKTLGVIFTSVGAVLGVLLYLVGVDYKTTLDGANKAVETAKASVVKAEAAAAQSERELSNKLLQFDGTLQTERSRATELARTRSTLEAQLIAAIVRDSEQNARFSERDIQRRIQFENAARDARATQTKAEDALANSIHAQELATADSKRTEGALTAAEQASAVSQMKATENLDAFRRKIDGQYEALRKQVYQTRTFILRETSQENLISIGDLGHELDIRISVGKVHLGREIRDLVIKDNAATPVCSKLAIARSQTATFGNAGFTHRLTLNDALTIGTIRHTDEAWFTLSWDSAGQPPPPGVCTVT
jgi:hypothetical protein